MLKKKKHFKVWKHCRRAQWTLQGELWSYQNRFLAPTACKVQKQPLAEIFVTGAIINLIPLMGKDSQFLKALVQNKDSNYYNSPIRIQPDRSEKDITNG